MISCPSDTTVAADGVTSDAATRQSKIHETLTTFLDNDNDHADTYIMLRHLFITCPPMKRIQFITALTVLFVQQKNRKNIAFGFFVSDHLSYVLDDCQPNTISEQNTKETLQKMFAHACTG